MRWVMVDDTDSGIKYTGDWIADKGSLDSSGNWGPPYMSTLHGTKTQGSFTYSFSGSAFTLTGAIQVPRTTASTSTSWECIVDGTSITVDNPQGVENRIEFCAKTDLTDGPHTLEVTAKGTSAQTFWFDHLQYSPSASVSLANAALSIDTSDPMWGFGTGWNPIFPGYMTNQTGSKVDFEFDGISFKWYGYYDARFPFAVSTASYSIDGGTPIDFTLNGVSAEQTSVQYSQVFFTSPTLSPGTHKVEVVYKGSTNTTPLSVQVVIVQNGASSSGISGGGISGGSTSGGTTSGGATLTSTTGVPPSGSPSVDTLASTVTSTGGTVSPTSGSNATFTGSAISGEGTPTNAPSNSNSSNTANISSTSSTSKSNIGAILGGVVGGVAIILLFAALLFWFCKSRKKRRLVEEAQLTVDVLPEPYFDRPQTIQRNVYSPAFATSRSRLASVSAPYDPRSYSESSVYPSTTQAPLTPVPFQSPPSSNRSFHAPTGKVAELQQSAPHVEAPRVIQDVDSGIRMMAVHGENQELVHVLPPVYTQT